MRKFNTKSELEELNGLRQQEEGLIAKNYTFINIMDQKRIEKLKKNLTPEQYNICFLKGTEPPGSGKYANSHDTGIYKCVICDSSLFYSDNKFDSGTGWPSFDRPVGDNVDFEDDTSSGMRRIEAICKTCRAHLGHVFDDGPTATSKRYCINSLALDFTKKE